MKLTITNKFTLIENPTKLTLGLLRKSLDYRDKAAQFQLKRMQNNQWLKRLASSTSLREQHQEAYNDMNARLQELKAKVKGSLIKELPGGHIVIPTGCLHLVHTTSEDVILDKRTDTGTTISLPWIAKPAPLRDYQQEAVDLMSNHHRGLINMATGLGKTLCAIYAIRVIKKKTLIVVPSESIAQQFIEQLKAAFGDHRVALFSGSKKKIADITVGIAASVVRKLDEFKKADLGLIIADECHHAPADTFFEITKGLGDVGKIFGLTATDFRSDGKDILITAGCGKVLVRRDVKWGIENGFLAKPIFIVRTVETVGGDYQDKLKAYQANVLRSASMNNQILSDIRYYLAQGKSVMCLVAEIEHGEMISKQLGCPFAHGEDKQSQEYVRQLNRKEISCLVGSSGKIGEGSDTKNVDVLVMANFMASKGITLQAVGRGLRKFDGKTECIILDYKPSGSSMLCRHADSRIEFYGQITDDVTLID
jgi:DNA excision repair protein ERCC-3